MGKHRPQQPMPQDGCPDDQGNSWHRWHHEPNAVLHHQDSCDEPGPRPSSCELEPEWPGKEVRGRPGLHTWLYGLRDDAWSQHRRWHQCDARLSGSPHPFDQHEESTGSLAQQSACHERAAQNIFSAVSELGGVYRSLSWGHLATCNRQPETQKGGSQIMKWLGFLGFFSAQHWIYSEI